MFHEPFFWGAAFSALSSGSIRMSKARNGSLQPDEADGRWQNLWEAPGAIRDKKGPIMYDRNHDTTVFLKAFG